MSWGLTHHELRGKLHMGIGYPPIRGTAEFGGHPSTMRRLPYRRPGSRDKMQFSPSFTQTHMWRLNRDISARGNPPLGNPPVEQSAARASDVQARTPHPLMTGTDTQGSGGSTLLVVKNGTLTMSMESRVGESDIPMSKPSEATEQVVEDVEMSDNLSINSDGSLVQSMSLTTVKPGANQESTGKKAEIDGDSNAGAGLTARQIKRRRQKAKKAEALAKASTQALSTSTPVMATGKRGRTEDSSAMLQSSGAEVGSVPTTGKRRKAKKRKVVRQESEMPAFSTQSEADKPLPEKEKAKGPQMSIDTLPSTSGVSFARVAAKAMTVEIHTDKQDGLLSKGQQDYLDSYLWKAIEQSKDALTFEGKSVVDGIVKVHCSNAFSREWLEKVIAKIPACENSKFILVESSKERLLRASVWIPGPSCSSAELLTRIRVQNKDLDTTRWRVYSCTRQKSATTSEAGSHLVLGIDLGSLKVLKSKYSVL